MDDEPILTIEEAIALAKYRLNVGVDIVELKEEFIKDGFTSDKSDKIVRWAAKALIEMRQNEKA